MLQNKTTVKIRGALFHWYDSEKRDLPWRQTRDPYSIWVSEIMLQQTQVQTVIPYYRRWMRAFPTLRRLAKAPEEKVLKLWEGLGYYSRARNLKKAAQKIQQDFNGVVPENYQDILSLPGIGKYTAGAILSIAHDQPLPVLDGNVKRVLARRATADEIAECLKFLEEQAARLASVKSKADQTNDGSKPSRDPGQRARENLVLVLFNHHDFVTIR